MITKKLLHLSFLLSPSLYSADQMPSKHLKSLVQDRSFAFFDLGVSNNEKQQLHNLTINQTIVLNNYGDIDKLESDIVDFLIELGNNRQDAQAAAHIIYTIVLRDIALCGAPTGWIALRAFEPNDSYDLPRWHTDGTFYLSEEHCCYKLAYALKGPATLFVRLPHDTRAEFFKIQNSTFAEMNKKLSKEERYNIMHGNRIKLAELVDPYNLSYLPADTAAIFVTGNPYRSAIHSEPPIHENRLFMSIVPGSYEQIQEWKIKNN